jgi:hypothetical protein
MTIKERIDCVKRELDRRKRFFPRYVEMEKMSDKTAGYEIACMESVLQTLTQLKGIVE